METIRFKDLEPRFLVYLGGGRRRYVGDFTEAQGVIFLCPACFRKNGGPVGTHAVEVTFRDRGVPDEEGSHGHNGQPTRWAASTAFDELTLSPSIDLGPKKGENDCGWHGFVEQGVARSV